jgi:cobalt-zinc-cadmium efflux system membrane fusion protein
MTRLTNRLWALALMTLIATLFVYAPARAHGDDEHTHADEAKPAPNSAQVPMGGGTPRRLPDGGVWLPKPIQHRLNVRTVQAQVGTHARALELNGRIVSDPNAGGKVQATQEGRIEAGPQGLPLAGQKVAKGQVLAWLHPTPSSLERGNQIATLADLDAQYALAERKFARYEQLEGAIPRKDIEAARQERDALKKRRAAISASVSAPEALRAPVAGTLVSAQASVGQIVDARDVLFEVVDTSRLMVEALAYDPAQAQGLGEASATLPDGTTLPLRHVGGDLRLRDQAMSLLFRITQAPATLATLAKLALGQPVKVTAATQGVIKGVAAPRSALVRNAAGDTVVWLHTAAEQFSPRTVRFEALDGRAVVVTSGLQAGERVVTEGANLLAQVR